MSSSGIPHQESGIIVGMRVCEEMCYNRISIQMHCILMGWVPQRGTLPKVHSLGRSYVWTKSGPVPILRRQSYTIPLQKPSSMVSLGGGDAWS
jgi:hypothetical protein